MADVAALILAAGRGTRFGADPDTTKLLAPLADGRPMLAHVAALARASRAAPVLVVTGHARREIEAALAGEALTFVHNADHASGMAASLRAGIAALPPRTKGVLVLLGDMPLVRSDTLEHLVDAFSRDVPDAVVPAVKGQRGNPALVGRSLFARIMELGGDEGARRILFDPGVRVVECEVDDPGIFADVDTPGALAALNDPARS